MESIAPTMTPPRPLAILCGGLIDGRHDTLLGASVVVVREDRIIEVRRGRSVPRGTERIDLGTQVVLPGLIDAHVHPLIHSDAYQMDHLRHASAYKALWGMRAVQGMLLAGWTTLRMAGDADVFYAGMDIRRAVQEGLYVGPRLCGAAHYISCTGGGGDINWTAPEQCVAADGLVVDGVDAMRRAVRQEIKYGSDWIKILVSGAFMSAGDDPRATHFSPEEMRTAVEEAQRLRVPVMAHAHGTESIRLAVEAGVRSIEHGTFIDAAGIQAMVAHGTWLIPTLYIGEYALRAWENSAAQQKMVMLSRRYQGEHNERLRSAVQAGVRLGVGTDNVGFSPRHATRELSLMVDIGYSPMQALQAATASNAELLGWDDRIGTIEAGKLADMIAVPGNPLEDLEVLQRVSWVMLGGTIITPERLGGPPPMS